MNELTKLAEKQNAIFLAEIGAWLHLLWKYDWKFIEHHCLGGAKEWNAKRFLGDLAANHAGSPLAELLNEDKYLPLLGELGGGTKLSDFLRRKEPEWLVTLLAEAHGRSSGVDKPWHIDCNQQAFGHVALTSAFGYEERILCDGDYRPDQLIDELNKALSGVRGEPWKALPGVRRALRKHLSRVPAETRQPGNDITVYDQTAMAVAFFKAALARLVVYGEAGHRWRTLAVRVDALEWLSGSSKVPDLLGRQGMISGAWDEVARIVECEYPLGAEIYRDEAQIAFLVTDANVLKWSGKKTLRDLLRVAVEDKTNGELSPDAELTGAEGSGRWLFDFGKQIAAAPPSNTSNVETINSTWENRDGLERCSNCGLRPFGKDRRARDRQICDTCLGARVSRSETWWQKGRDRTVWLEEAADVNGRVALITGAFDLSAWLNGTALTSVPAVHAISGQACRPVAFAEIEQDAERWRSGGDPGVCKDLVFEFDKVEARPKDYMKTLRDDWVAYFDSAHAPSDGTLFAIANANQRPSFARVRRVWESTTNFWDSLLPAQGRGSILDKIGRSDYERLRIVPDPRQDNFGQWHAYVLRNAGVEIAAVWVPEDGGSFVTADNLKYLDRQHGQESLAFNDGQEIEVEELAGYMRRTAATKKVKIRRTERLGDFHPVIRLLATPATFMAIVPAQAAWRAVGAIRVAYELQMNKVRNRLPLHLRVVFAHRYTPLRAILGAGRRMLQYQRPAEEWTVAGGGTLTRNGQSASWKVECPDQHFPYAYLADASHGTSVSHKAFRDTLDLAGRVCPMARVSDLATGDRIWYTPSTVDFEWLESSGVRFTLSYRDGFRRGTPSRPWLLDDLPRTDELWDRLSNKRTGLENRQIRGLTAVIEQRRKEWEADPGDPIFAAFCRSTLAEADWGQPLSPADLDEFTRQAVSGMLNDVIDLHTRVLKEKVT